MFTSRAEYRLQLREDNADLRLTERGRELGVVDDARWDAFARKRDAIARELERLRFARRSIRASSPRTTRERVLGQPIEREYSLAELLRRPGVTYASLMTLPRRATPSPIRGRRRAGRGRDQVRRLHRSAARGDRARHARRRSLRLPLDLDYRAVRGLSAEAQHKLNLHKPETIGQAARISGMTPAAISLLLVHLKRGLDAARIRPTLRTRVGDRVAEPARGASPRNRRRRQLGRRRHRHRLASRRARRRTALPTRRPRQARCLSRFAREMESHATT